MVLNVLVRQFPNWYSIKHNSVLFYYIICSLVFQIMIKFSPFVYVMTTNLQDKFLKSYFLFICVFDSTWYFKKTKDTDYHSSLM